MVKFIGDAVMFTAPTPDTLIDVSLRILRDPMVAAAGIELRAAAAWGPVLAQDGDYFGSTVNLAARLLAVAHPGDLVVAPALAEWLDGRRRRTELLRSQRLRGFDKPAGGDAGHTAGGATGGPTPP
ncbi:MAG: adenylate/guanylate cyclase domain-containing protein [Acidimicrobiales bacterium]